MRRIELSVVIPAWNRSTTIRRTVASIRGDSSDSFEVIVVDDGSTDGTDQIAEAAIAEAGMDGRVIRQANAGPAAARNAGVASARGEYFAFLDSDDYWFPWTLRLCLEALRSAAPALMFLQTVDGHGEGALAHNAPEGPARLMIFRGFLEAVEAVCEIRYATCNAVISRSAFEALGGFTPAAVTCEDTDLFMRGAQIGSCALLRGPPMVGHELGRADNLSADFYQVVKGFDLVMAENAKGRYPEAPSGRPLKDRMLAKIVASTILVAFASGCPRDAYRLLLSHAGQLLRGRDWHWLVRLPILPVLAYVKPESFRVRWRP